jgi:hypothetical protein
MYLFPWYMIRFSPKAKTPLVNEGGEDRELAMSGPPKVVGPGGYIYHSYHETNQCADVLANIDCE